MGILLHPKHEVSVPGRSLDERGRASRLNSEMRPNGFQAFCADSLLGFLMPIVSLTIDTHASRAMNDSLICRDDEAAAFW